MNETFQEFCKRILPVVQAGAEGKLIEATYKTVEVWEVVDDFLSCDFEYRIAEQKATPLPITPEMWAMIDPRYRWAYFHGGHVWFSIYELKKHPRGGFVATGGIDGFCQSPLNINTTEITPELSLTKRPDNYVVESDVNIGSIAVHDSDDVTVDATHYAKSIAGNHVDLYKRDPLNKEQWMTWDYQSSGWIKVQLFAIEPQQIK